VKVVATANASGKWYAMVVGDNDETVLTTWTAEARAGCAIRQALNTLQSDYGQPATGRLELTIDGW